jgi:hypothetical protein
MYVDSATAKNWPQYSCTLKMEVAYYSEMLLPTYKTTRRQHIPEDTYMITLNLYKYIQRDATIPPGFLFQDLYMFWALTMPII